MMVSPATAHVTIETVDTPASAEQMAVIFSRDPAGAVLESLLHSGSYGRFSVFATDPVDEIVVPNTQPDAIGPTPLDLLERRVASWPTVCPPAGQDVPFPGGWIGYLAYEAGHAEERLARTTIWDLPIPLVQFRLYDHAAMFDHLQGCWYAVCVDWPMPIRAGRPSLRDRLAAVRRSLDRAARTEPCVPPAPDIAGACHANYSRKDYLDKVRRAQSYIAQGDIYEVNLTRRFTAKTGLSAPALYQRLRAANPSSHAAFLPVVGGAVLSSSPELFVALRHGHAVTRPIKGTRPRSPDPARDAALRVELADSEKDAAELNMIVDLSRNDLGRVCRYGSVVVSDPVSIETHPTVFHRVATIEGDLRPGCGWADLLRAAFPGGSITGAPKIRAMQIIDELEPTARGVYCGSIGMIGLDGSMQLNIAIRTMVQCGRLVHAWAGGAIVADSVPSDEDEEVHAKASGMFRAMGCALPDAVDTRVVREVIAS